MKKNAISALFRATPLHRVGILTAAMFGLAACETAPSAMTASGAAAASETQAESADESAEGGKQSLDALLDEHDKVTLLDDDTGEEKLICRRIEARTGSRLGSRKLCATRKEWREQEELSKEDVGGIQRRLDARCPPNGPGGPSGAC